MSIDRYRGKVIFVCDGEDGTCGESFETNEAQFDDAVAKFRVEGEEADGWTKTKVSGEWEHFCPECSKTEAGSITY